jgi:hypothetical protein
MATPLSRLDGRFPHTTKPMSRRTKRIERMGEASINDVGSQAAQTEPSINTPDLSSLLQNFSFS